MENDLGKFSPLVKVPVVFFMETSGSEPVRKWLLSLEKNDRKIIGDDLKTVERAKRY